MLAHVAGEDVLREIFASDQDVHAETAAEVLSIDPGEVGPAERSKAKMVNYGIAYGLSDFGLADRLQISREEAGAYIARYFERFPAVKRFIDKTIEKAENEGLVKTLMGRRRLVPELRSSNRQRRSLGRAPRGQHRHPGNRRGHHQGRDGSLPALASGVRLRDAARSSRSTTSSSSRGPRPRWRRPES